MNTDAAPLIYVLDDDQAFRESLSWMLHAAGFRVRVFATAEYFLATYEPHAGACVVLDIRMPGMSGLDLQEELIRRKERMPIIFVTAHGDVSMAVRAVKRGAFDFLEKPFKGRALLALIRKALRQDPLQLAAAAKRNAINEALAELSDREHAVLSAVLQGKTNKAIASELGISVKTVESHRSHMMDKLGAASIAELVRVVLDASPEPRS